MPQEPTPVEVDNPLFGAIVEMSGDGTQPLSLLLRSGGMIHGYTMSDLGKVSQVPQTLSIYNTSPTSEADTLRVEVLTSEVVGVSWASPGVVRSPKKSKGGGPKISDQPFLSWGSSA